MPPVSEVKTVAGGTDGAQQQDAPMGGKPLVGIIYPPPEVRNIVDKTASFVARNGPEFESRIRQNEANNAKFNFLTTTDPYHAYYKHKVTEFREGRATEPGTAPLMGAAHGNSMMGGSAASGAAGAAGAAKPATLAAAAAKAEPIVLKDPPPEYEFIADPPSISAYDLDVVKLTAQFVARNGRQFLTNLMNREQRNFQFDFLRPQHSLFNYFTKLVEQYTKILIPPKDLMTKLKKELEAPIDASEGVMGTVRYRAEWERQQERQKKKEEEAKEKERVAYACIDWHDFVVVETVDFQPSEIGNFPPPTTPEEVGARMLMEERIASAPAAKPAPGGGAGAPAPVTFLNEDDLEEEELEEEEPEAVVPPKPAVAPTPAPPAAAAATKATPIEVRPAPTVKPPAAAAAGVTPAGGAPIMRPSSPNMDIVDMEEDSDDEDVEEVTVDKRPMAPPPVVAPPPINPEKVVIKANYDPKAAAPSMAAAAGGAPGVEEQMLISPLTGERVPASKMAEHMRIGLLDPKWVEQKDRALAEKMQRTEVFAPGASIENSLRNMASRRTDIFGAGDEETDIGKKFGEEEDEGSAAGPSDSSKVVWDGHSASMEATARKARENITVADQIKHLQQMKGILGTNTDKIGPTPTSGPPSSSSAPRAPIPPPPMSSRPAPPPGVPNIPASSAAPVPPPQLQRPPNSQPPPPPFNIPRPPVVPVPPPRPPMMGMRPPMGMPPRPPMGMPPRMMAPPMGGPGGPPGGGPPGGGPGGPPSRMMGGGNNDEPPNKKAKSEDNLMPEGLWLAQHHGPITVKVVVPQDPSKPEWNLNGQTLTYTLPLTDTFAVIKSKIMEATTMPIGKQKLQVDGIFTKDSNSLAFYNVNNGAEILLSQKERGGRKK